MCSTAGLSVWGAPSPRIPSPHASQSELVECEAVQDLGGEGEAAVITFWRLSLYRGGNKPMQSYKWVPPCSPSSLFCIWLFSSADSAQQQGPQTHQRCFVANAEVVTLKNQQPSAAFHSFCSSALAAGLAHFSDSFLSSFIWV